MFDFYTLDTKIYVVKAPNTKSISSSLVYWLYVLWMYKKRTPLSMILCKIYLWEFLIIFYIFFLLREILTEIYIYIFKTTIFYVIHFEISLRIGNYFIISKLEWIEGNHRMVWFFWNEDDFSISLFWIHTKIYLNLNVVFIIDVNAFNMQTEEQVFKQGMESLLNNLARTLFFDSFGHIPFIFLIYLWPIYVFLNSIL